MIKKYIDYIKDNPEGYWFKRKLYGYGWVPATKQGWYVVLIFLAFVIWIGVDLGNNPTPTNSELTSFFVKLSIAIVILIVISYKKGEKPKWQWGYEKEE